MEYYITQPLGVSHPFRENPLLLEREGDFLYVAHVPGLYTFQERGWGVTLRGVGSDKFSCP